MITFQDHSCAAYIQVLVLRDGTPIGTVYSGKLSATLRGLRFPSNACAKFATWDDALAYVTEAR